MTDSLDVYKTIAKREKTSRQEAERLLEEKTRELRDKHCALEGSATKLQDSHSLLSNIMSASPDGILTCSKDFIVLDYNVTAEKQFSRAKNDLRGQPIDQLIPGLSGVLSKRSGNFSLETPVQARREDGSDFPVEVHAHAGSIGENAHYVVFAHDISARVTAAANRRQMEQQVDEARRLEAIGSLSAGIAHEINTPIQFIGDNLDFLRDALMQIYRSYKNYHALFTAVDGDPSYERQTNKIHKFNTSINLPAQINEITSALNESCDGIKQVRDIVLLMKEFSHPGSGGKADADLNKIIKNVLALCRNRWKNSGEIELDLACDLPKIKCRMGQIQQVILNIVLNAVDAIEADGLDKRKILIQTQYTDEFVSIDISDTGPGVPDSLKQKIFDPFFTTKPVGKGTGQGLALAKDCIVKGHHGHLTLLDKEGYATTFHIRLKRREHNICASGETSDVQAA